MDWETPVELFDALDSVFEFELDAAATAANTKCDNFISPQEDAFGVDWSSRVPAGSSVWLNPPYGRGVGKWLEKAYSESLRGITVVVLIMVRTDSNWWKDWAMRAAEIRLIRGRVHFERNGESGPATAPSAVLVFSEDLRTPAWTLVRLPRGN